MREYKKAMTVNICRKAKDKWIILYSSDRFK